jgi:hypothetical protein
VGEIMRTAIPELREDDFFSEYNGVLDVTALAFCIM